MTIDFSWHKRAKECIAQGALTNSKMPESFVFGQYPTHVVSGDGATLLTMEGDRYIDYICGLGTNLTGYGNSIICNHASMATRDGISLSLSSTLEVLYAEKLKALFPFVDRWKFLKTGSEAASASIKMARAFNGRELILSEGYHGHHDNFVSLSSPAAGVKDKFNIEKINIDDIFGKKGSGYPESKPIPSAIIIEPIITDNSEDRIKTLNRLRYWCNVNDVIMIFDEIITGFRYESLAVCRHYKIWPDLILLGKAIGGGFPLAAVGGRKEIMDNPDYFVSSTFAGDRVSLSAALTQLNIAKEINANLWMQAGRFKDAFNSICPGNIRIEGYNTRGAFKAVSDEYKALFFQEAIKCKILFGPSWFFCSKHDQYTDLVINICKDIINKINRGNVKLEGLMPRSPFAQKVRENK